MVVKILDLKTLSWQRRPLHCQKMEGNKEEATNAKKEGRLSKHELKLYFTLTQKWSSTKYMFIFCNKWRLLHEKRVQSRQYFFGYINMAGELFCCCCFCFVLFSMSPPSWSWSSRVPTLDLKHTDDTDASVQRTFIAKLHNPWSLWDFWG